MSTQNDLTALKQAVTQDPGNGEARYRHGAHLAQAGQYAQAIEEITHALVLQPSLHTARLQLALLHLTSGQTAQSLAIVRPLTALSEEDALNHFGAGIQALIENHLPACLKSLQRGVALNRANPPLNRDMQLLIDKVTAALPAQPEDRERTDFSLYTAGRA